MSCSKEVAEKSASQRSSSEVQPPVPSAQRPEPIAQRQAPSAQRPLPNAHPPSLYRIIPFNLRHGNCGGSLVQFQQGAAPINALPFNIGKVLVMSDIRTDDVRGLHAHYETEEILIALTGGCIVDMDDGKGSHESMRLSALSEIRTDVQCPAPKDDIKVALLLYPHVWRVMRDFEPGTTLMVVANIKYDEADYIRDRAEFERVAKGWPNLGGSDGR